MSGLPAASAALETGALTEYTFVPYRGKLAANVPAGEALVDLRRLTGWSMNMGLLSMWRKRI